MVAGRDDDELLLRDGDMLKLLVTHSRAQPDSRSPFLDVGRHLGRYPQPQVEFAFLIGKGLLETRDCIWEEYRAEDAHERDAHDRGASCDRPCARLPDVELLDCAVDVLEVLLAGGREAHPSCSALEQLDLRARLELRYRVGKRRLADEELLCRSGVTAARRERLKVSQVVEIHCREPSRLSLQHYFS